MNRRISVLVTFVALVVLACAREDYTEKAKRVVAPDAPLMYSSAELNVFGQNVVDNVMAILDSLESRRKVSDLECRLLIWGYDYLWSEVKMKMDNANRLAQYDGLKMSYGNKVYTHKTKLDPLPTKQEIHNRLLKFLGNERNTTHE